MNKKLVSVIFFIIIGAVALYSCYILFGNTVYNYYQSWKIGRAYHKFETEFTNYLKNDTYGGVTPEETYKLFVQTLKSGDIESASKYFYWEHQVQEQEKLQQMKDTGQLESYVASLPDWGQMREDNSYSISGTKRFSWTVEYDEEETFYDPLAQKEVTFPAGEGRGVIDFQFNSQANIWKIY